VCFIRSALCTPKFVLQTLQKAPFNILESGASNNHPKNKVTLKV
jgi:hypothetical protein